MKAGVLAIAAALATGVVAKGHAARRHAHEAFHLEKKGYELSTAPASEATCGCTTIYTTITGGATRMSSSDPIPLPPSASIGNRLTDTAS